MVAVNLQITASDSVPRSIILTYPACFTEETLIFVRIIPLGFTGGENSDMISNHDRIIFESA